MFNFNPFPTLYPVTLTTSPPTQVVFFKWLVICAAPPSSHHSDHLYRARVVLLKLVAMCVEYLYLFPLSCYHSNHLYPARVVFLTLATKEVGVQAHSKDFTSEAEESYDLETQ